MTVELLEGAVRAYRWGSTSAIPELLGRPPSDEPVAELWLGAHPAGAARVGVEGRTLDRVIAADPVAMLGADVARRYDALPFLMKVLAAAEPLSLQVHPTIAQAQAGFEREEAAGVPVDAAQRFYRDRNHKPELICALTPFEAMCGFRPPAETLEVLATIPTSMLDPVREQLASGAGAGGLRDALTWLLDLDAERAGVMITEILNGCQTDDRLPYADERAVAADLAVRYPRDAGVVISLLLNHVRLEPGEALFLEAGTLHSYLCGMGIELMANSDNVLRGGLTTKPVDTRALIEIVDTSPQLPVRQSPPLVSGVAEYDTPVPEYSLRRYEIGPTTSVETTGPAVVLCVDGTVDAGRHTLDRGSAAWIPAMDPPVHLSGRGTLFRAGVGDLALH